MSVPEGRGTSRAEEAAVRADLAAGAERAESVKAQVLIDRFLVDVVAAGITAEPLRATLYSGQGGEDRQARLVPAQEPVGRRG